MPLHYRQRRAVGSVNVITVLSLLASYFSATAGSSSIFAFRRSIEAYTSPFTYSSYWVSAMSGLNLPTGAALIA